MDVTTVSDGSYDLPRLQRRNQKFIWGKSRPDKFPDDFSHPFRPFLFSRLFPPELRSGSSNPYNGFWEALLTPPAGRGERHLQPPDTFHGL